MIVYNCNKYELPLFNTRLLLDYCGSFLGEKYTGCQREESGRIMEIQSFSNVFLMVGLFSSCSSPRLCQQEAAQRMVEMQYTVQCR